MCLQLVPAGMGVRGPELSLLEIDPPPSAIHVIQIAGYTVPRVGSYAVPHAGYTVPREIAS